MTYYPQNWRQSTNSAPTDMNNYPSYYDQTRSNVINQANFSNLDKSSVTNNGTYYNGYPNLSGYNQQLISNQNYNPALSYNNYLVNNVYNLNLNHQNQYLGNQNVQNNQQTQQVQQSSQLAQQPILSPVMTPVYNNPTYSPINTPQYNRLSNIYQYDYINNKYDLNNYQYDTATKTIPSTTLATSTPTPATGSINSSYQYDTTSDNSYQNNTTTNSTSLSGIHPINNYQVQFSNNETYPSYLQTSQTYKSTVSQVQIQSTQSSVTNSNYTDNYLSASLNPKSIDSNTKITSQTLPFNNSIKSSSNHHKSKSSSRNNNIANTGINDNSRRPNSFIENLDDIKLLDGPIRKENKVREVSSLQPINDYNNEKKSSAMKTTKEISNESKYVKTMSENNIKSSQNSSSYLFSSKTDQKFKKSADNLDKFSKSRKRLESEKPQIARFYLDDLEKLNLNNFPTAKKENLISQNEPEKFIKVVQNEMVKFQKPVFKIPDTDFLMKPTLRKLPKDFFNYLDEFESESESIHSNLNEYDDIDEEDLKSISMTSTPVKGLRVISRIDLLNYEKEKLEEKLKEFKLKEQRLIEEKMREERLKEEKLKEEKLREEKLREEKLKEEKLKEERLNEEKIRFEKLIEERIKEEMIRVQKANEDKQKVEKSKFIKNNVIDVSSDESSDNDEKDVFDSESDKNQVSSISPDLKNFKVQTEKSFFNDSYLTIKNRLLSSINEKLSHRNYEQKTNALKNSNSFSNYEKISDFQSLTSESNQKTNPNNIKEQIVLRDKRKSLDILNKKEKYNASNRLSLLENEFIIKEESKETRKRKDSKDFFIKSEDFDHDQIDEKSLSVAGSIYDVPIPNDIDDFSEYSRFVNNIFKKALGK